MYRRFAVERQAVFLALLFTFTVLAQPVAVRAQNRQVQKEPDSAQSCNQFLPTKKLLGAKNIGPEQCRIVSEEIVFNVKRQPYRHVELRISGTLEGWATKQGRRFNYFNDGPDFVFTQSGNTTPRYKGIGRYEAETGHGISLFFPQNAADWNGKLFVTAHGAGPYEQVGILLPRDPNAAFNPLANANRYVGLMVDKGYAVAHTLRSSQMESGDIPVTLEDGQLLQHFNQLSCRFSA